MENQPLNHAPRVTRREAIGTLALGGAAIVSDQSAASLRAASGSLPRVAPSEAGVDPAGVLAFVDAAERALPGGLHSLMIVRHGKVAAEGWWRPYAPRHPHMLYSLSKSFTSTAVGLAISEGLLTVDAPVTSFFPDRLPATVSDNLAAMRVRHLLTMSTGHEKDATGDTIAAPDGDWVRAFLSLPVPKEPGSLFIYNSAATYMLSAIVQKLTGRTVLDYLTPRLFEPLGFEHPTWETCPRGIDKGGWGLSVRTEEIARFGQLYLQGGEWKGRRLLPAAWVAEATTKKISNGTDPNSDWAQGYCYQFWRCRHGAFRGDGAYGQFCVVMPEQDAVVAITSGVNDLQGVLNLVWDHLLPAMRQPGTPTASAGDAALRTRLSGLAIPAPSGSRTSDTAKRVSGRVYRFDANPQKLERLSLTLRGGEAELALRDRAGDRTVRCGLEKWLETRAPIADQPAAKAAALGAWTEAGVFQLKACFYETPFIQTATLRFTGDEVEYRVDANVPAIFGPPDAAAPLTGRAV
jgi:CubicO group peptidase (beta-lactamase class C family)